MPDRTAGPCSWSAFSDRSRSGATAASCRSLDRRSASSSPGSRSRPAVRSRHPRSWTCCGPRIRPPHAVRNLRSYVSRLRRVVGDDRLTWQPGGYRLDVDDTDLRRAERLVAEADDGARADPARAAALLTDALALWRGEPLADLPECLPLAAELARLREWRLVAPGAAPGAAARDRAAGRRRARARAAGTDRAAAGTTAAAADARAASGRPNLGRPHDCARLPPPPRRRDRAGPGPGAGRSGAASCVRTTRSSGPPDPAPAPGGRSEDDTSTTPARPTGSSGGAPSSPRCGRRCAATRSSAWWGPVGSARRVSCSSCWPRPPSAPSWSSWPGSPRRRTWPPRSAPNWACGRRPRASVRRSPSDSATARSCSCSTTASTSSTPRAGLVAESLAHCPRLTVLATSRRRLGVPGEQVVRLGPLPEPDQDRAVLRSCSPAPRRVRRRPPRGT